MSNSRPKSSLSFGSENVNSKILTSLKKRVYVFLRRRNRVGPIEKVLLERSKGLGVLIARVPPSTAAEDKWLSPSPKKEESWVKR